MRALAWQMAGTSKHIHDEGYKRSLIGRALVPYYEGDAADGPSGGGGGGGPPLAVTARQWNAALGYFEEGTTVHAPTSATAGTGAGAAAPAKAAKKKAAGGGGGSCRRRHERCAGNLATYLFCMTSSSSVFETKNRGRTGRGDRGTGAGSARML